MNRHLLQQIAEGIPLGVCFEADPAPASDPAPAGDPAPADPPAADPAPTGWLHADGVAGEGDIPEWFKSDKYASVSEQAKAYKDLEGKFGAFTGAPEAYEVKVSEELVEKGIELDPEDLIVQELQKVGSEIGLNQEGFSRLINTYGMVKVAEREADALRVADELASLGQNGKGRVDSLNKWGSAHLSEELFAGFQEMVQSGSAVQALEQLVSMTRAAPLNPDGGASQGGVTEAELQEMQFAKDDYGNRKINTDPAFKADYNRKMKEFYGDGDHHIVVG